MKKAVKILSCTVLMALSFCIYAWAGWSVKSDKEIETGINDPMVQVRINQSYYNSWVLEKDSKIIFTKVDIPYKSYCSLWIDIFTPNEDGSYYAEPDAGKRPGFLVGPVSTESSFSIYEEIRKSGQLRGYQPEECIYQMVILYDTDNGKAWSYGSGSFKFFSQTDSQIWKSDSRGWWIQNSDGSYLKNTWYEDKDGRWYYFGSDGYMRVSGTTPDGCYVGSDGAYVPSK